MPVHLERRRGRLVAVEPGGRVVAHPRSEESAKGYVRLRNAILHGWKPTGRKGKS